MSKQELDTLQDIKQIMERSSRFISLSGWSGVAAGGCALIGAALAYPIVSERHIAGGLYPADDLRCLLWLAAATFVAALSFAILFSCLRAKRLQIPVWGHSTKRLLWSVALPLAAGGALLLKMASFGYFGLLAPGCLLIYGMALFSGSKQTLSEVKYLGYAQILLGLIALCFIGHGLLFWTLGFGVFHIVYGIFMWFKHERK
jgi:hypothetical protein